MTKPPYFARRLRFQNGERTSTIMRTDTGLPVHEVVLFLDRYRRRGKAANTLHAVACSLVLLYRWLDLQQINLVQRLRYGEFLTFAELHRLADLAQYRADDLDDAERRDGGASASKVRSLERFRMRQQRKDQRRLVDVPTRATRIRHFKSFLGFIGEYYAHLLPAAECNVLLAAVKSGTTLLEEMVPRVAGRAQLGSRMGISKEHEELLIATIHPDSPTNPWKVPFVRLRNFAMVAFLLAGGIRRGELAGLQVGDLSTSTPRVRIYRRADDPNDRRLHQPNTKTHDREIELDAEIMKVIWHYLKLRRQLLPARKLAQIWVTDDGRAALSYDAVGKIFNDIRRACHALPRDLTSHVLRHTWNDRFSEVVKAMGIPTAKEEKARATQQGWTDGSQMAAVYTRRTTEELGRKVSKELQEKMELKLNGSH